MARTNPRQTQFQQTHYFRKTVNFNDAGIASGVIMGTLPGGAQILNTHVNITTAFNAGTTNVLAVGTTGTGAQIATGTNTAAGTLGYKTDPTGSALSPFTTLAADTDVFVSFTQTGTAATAGKAVVAITYMPNNDQ